MERNIKLIGRTLLAIAIGSGVPTLTGFCGISITGHVVDHKGNQVGGADVLLVRSGVSSLGSTTVTDDRGDFRFDNVDTRISFDLGASKDRDYLMPPGGLILGFPAGGNAPMVPAGGQSRNLVIRFGPPGGRLIIQLKTDNGKTLEGKFKIAKKGGQWVDRFNYIPLNVVMPTGKYQIKVFTMRGDYIDTIDVAIEERRTMERTITVPSRYVPK